MTQTTQEQREVEESGHYGHLSHDIYEAMTANVWRTHERAQEQIKRRISPEGDIQTDKPLERMLAIVEKYRETLKRKVDPRTLAAFDNDEEGYRLPGQCSEGYREFTQEMLESPNFPYTANEATLVGKYQRELCGNSTGGVIVDRILLRKALDEVENISTRENIWYALTLHSGDVSTVKYLQEQSENETKAALEAMKTVVLPTYEKFLADTKDAFKRCNDLGLEINGSAALTRKRFIWHCVDRARYNGLLENQGGNSQWPS
ncbi:MAG: hypothetical protein ABH864_07240 [archaeon]